MFDPLNAPASFFRKKLNPSDFTGNLGALSAATEKRAPTFARTRPAATAAPTAAAAAPAPAPETSLSYKGGQAIGAVLPMLKRAGEVAWDVGTYPHRKARNFAEDVAAGISGGSPPLPEPLIRAPIPAAAAPAPAPLTAAIAAPAGVAANPAMVTPPAAPVAQPVPAPGALPAAPALTTIAQPTSAVPQIPTIGSGGAVGNAAGAAVGSGFTRPTSVAPVTLADINNPFSDAGISKHNFESAMNTANKPSERKAIAELFTRAFSDQNAVAMAQQQNDSQREQVAMQTQTQRDVTAQGEQGANARANGRNATDVALEQQRGQNAIALAGEQAAPITDGQGKVFTRRGATATPVVDDKGNQISTANGRMSQAEVVKVLSEQLTAAQGSLAPDPAYIEQLRGQLQAALTGGAQQPAAKVPDGYTQVGTKNGKPVYRDASGQTFIGE